MTNHQKPIGLWRQAPPESDEKKSRGSFSLKKVFPSGRQALTYALKTVGMSREKRVAIPEWSSHCVVSSVGKVATPVPMKEVIEKSISVDGVLLYEQWGWPFVSESYETIKNIFGSGIVIIDRVDSADIDNEHRMKLYLGTKQVDVISLSKILGLPGGGMGMIDGEWMHFEPNESHKILSQELLDPLIKSGNDKVEDLYIKTLDMYKSNVAYLHSNLRMWIEQHDVVSVIDDEANLRRKNLETISQSGLAKDWPEWMHQAVNNGAAPGVVPLMCGEDIDSIKTKQQQIKDTYNIDTEIFHFNWSGNPIATQYEPCLVFPVHGEVDSEIIKKFGN